MNNKMILISSILALSLLSACGNANKNASGHEGHNQATTGEQAGSHGGHASDQQMPSDKVKATFAFASGGVKANENKELTIQITDKDGKSVNDFQVNHEKLLHLIVVNRDLSFFNHIHPDYKGNGKFTISTAFPTGGDYKLFADFIPKGGTSTTLSEWVKVEGKAGDQAAIIADSKLVKDVDGKEIELALSSTKSSQEVTLTFNILDAQTKKGINNLEPYLGAVGHVVILSADAEQYIHVHPLDEKATGPKAQFATSFPKSGTYKIWGQFQHQGKVITVPFVVDIK
ncbi:hypothetical protein ACFQI7_19210 [Paenibacillus allorhizosphaerae]|uniref:Secreted protein n=1 Tax=Paenibacillus allorhizosphaerae TaxID=2849866 RepID=A0ABM8VNT6_9BACL|nr:hypothetical protein [Paenibacillus allorhizosphaerae]CAG7651960.1 hypothetical protein PAECIP111802_05101 [Paenibacillus allorhizosphaerae]